MIKYIIKYLFTLFSIPQKEEKVKEVVVTKKLDLITYHDYITASGKYPDRLNSGELTEELKANAEKLLSVVNPFLHDLGIESVTVTSGFRPQAVNSKTTGAGAKSTHLRCLGIDLADSKGSLMNLVLENMDKLKQYSLYAEDFRYTPVWLHLQCVPPSSKKRIFVPNTKPAPAPNRWDGKYDTKKYDV